MVMWHVIKQDLVQVREFMYPLSATIYLSVNVLI